MKFINVLLFFALFLAASCSQSAENKKAASIETTVAEQKAKEKATAVTVVKTPWTLIKTPQLIEKIRSSVELSEDQVATIQAIADDYGFDKLSKISQGEIYGKIKRRLQGVLTPEQYEVFINAQ